MYIFLYQNSNIMAAPTACPNHMASLPERFLHRFGYNRCFRRYFETAGRTEPGLDTISDHIPAESSSCNVSRREESFITESYERVPTKSSTEVSRARKALIANDILDDFGKQYSFEDPIYEYWLKNVFFKD